MLNITGGGEERFKREIGELTWLKPSLVVNPDVTLRELEEKIRTI